MFSTLARLLALCMVIVSVGTVSAHAATISGQVVVPASPTGSAPTLADLTVRVQGTTLSGRVDGNTGNFSIADVTSGAVTLLLVEPAGNDVFTQVSKRTQVTATGDVTGVSFSLQYHWQQLAGYPAVYLTAGYESWTMHFVSDQVGYMMFRVPARESAPLRVELYKTLDGGANWTQVGMWVKTGDNSQILPSSAASMFFADANHGVVLAANTCGPCGECGVGFLCTSDGGASWNFAGLPTVASAYSMNIDRYAKIDGSRWIAAGTIGCAVQGYGSGFYAAIWETSDAGATWTVATSTATDVGSCTGLAANADGDAVAFRTPYCCTGMRLVSVRSGGTWTTTSSADIVVNSGYGPGDVAMIGDTAWVCSSGGLDQGLFRSDQAGAVGTWTKASDSATQYMAFGTPLKAFGVSGGAALISYDGGMNWLHQSGGGGFCCHDNNIFAFDAVHAIWQDSGVGDPDGHRSLFTYAEPWVANFEVLPGVALPDGFAAAGDHNMAVASCKLLNQGPIPIQLDSITVRACGTGNDATSIESVKLWWDVNKNGIVEAGDTLLGTGVFSADDGSLTLSAAALPALSQFVPQYLLVTYDLAANASVAKTFTCSLAAQDVIAKTADTLQAVSAAAPAAQTIAGRTMTTAEVLLSDDFENGLGRWTATTEDPVPDAGYGWLLCDTVSASATHSASVHEDRGHEGNCTRDYLTLNSGFDLSAAGAYYLAFNQQYALDPSFSLYVEASTDGTTTWNAVGSYGSYSEWNSFSTNGAFEQQVIDLAGVTGKADVRLRFTLDWTSGWYYNGTWNVDDVRIMRVPPALPEDTGTGSSDGPDGSGGTNGAGDNSDTGAGSGSGSDSTSGGGSTAGPGSNGDTNSGGGSDSQGSTGSSADNSGEQDGQVAGEEPAAPPPPAAGMCGAGLAEAFLLSIALLTAVRRPSGLLKSAART